MPENTKRIPNHPEGETRERRAWTQFFSLMKRIGEVLSGDLINKSEKKKLMRQAKNAGSIRKKYD